MRSMRKVKFWDPDSCFVPLRYLVQDFFSPMTAPCQSLISHPPAAPSEAASRSFLITIFYINFLSLLLDASPLSTLVYNVISGLLVPTRPSRLTLDPSRFRSGVSGWKPLRWVSAQILTFTHTGSQNIFERIDVNYIVYCTPANAGQKHCTYYHETWVMYQ